MPLELKVGIGVIVSYLVIYIAREILTKWKTAQDLRKALGEKAYRKFKGLPR